MWDWAEAGFQQDARACCFKRHGRTMPGPVQCAQAAKALGRMLALASNGSAGLITHCRPGHEALQVLTRNRTLRLPAIPIKVRTILRGGGRPEVHRRAAALAFTGRKHSPPFSLTLGGLTAFFRERGTLFQSVGVRLVILVALRWSGFAWHRGWICPPPAPLGPMAGVL